MWVSRVLGLDPFKRMPRVTVGVSPMVMSAEHRSEFEALHRQWWRLHMSENFSRGTINPKQTNKQTNKQTKHFTKYLFCAAWRPIYVQKVALQKTQCYLQCTIRTHCNPKQNFTKFCILYTPNKLLVKCNINKTSE